MQNSLIFKFAICESEGVAGGPYYSERDKSKGSSVLEMRIFQSPRQMVWTGSACVGAGINPVKHPHMLWLLKVLIFYSDKLNNIPWYISGLKKKDNLHLHVCFPPILKGNCYSISYPITEPIYRCWDLTSGLNCDSNNCSLCLCVRLCWGRGALWGTLDSQVTWLENDFALLSSVSTFSY